MIGMGPSALEAIRDRVQFQQPANPPILQDIRQTLEIDD